MQKRYVYELGVSINNPRLTLYGFNSYLLSFLRLITFSVVEDSIRLANLHIADYDNLKLDI